MLRHASPFSRGEGQSGRNTARWSRESRSSPEISRDAGGRWQLTELINANMAVSSFGEDEQGELYVLGYDKGTLYRVVGAAK